jgi:hypothetical protein
MLASVGTKIFVSFLSTSAVMPWPAICAFHFAENGQDGRQEKVVVQPLRAATRNDLTPPRLSPHSVPTAQLLGETQACIALAPASTSNNLQCLVFSTSLGRRSTETMRDGGEGVAASS